MPLFLISFMVCFITIRWSTVALPGIPPAWASVICTTFFTLSLMILSYTLPMLLAGVIPLSFEHLPLVPLPLYSLIMWAWSQLDGICPFWCILFIVVRRVFLCSRQLLRRFRLVCRLVVGFFSVLVFLLHFGVLWMWFLLLLVDFLLLVLATFFLIGCFGFLLLFFFVHWSYAGVPGLAWYSSSK